MLVCGRDFSTLLLKRIREAVQAEPSMSRVRLSRKICEWVEWRSANGRLQEMSCRKALNKLERAGILDLPKPMGIYAYEERGGNDVEPEAPELCCNLEGLGEVSV